MIATTGDGQKVDEDFSENGFGNLAEAEREVPAGRFEARLYPIVVPGSGETAWEVETALNGEVQRQRFATELRARAWLAIRDKPRFALYIR